MTLKVVSLALKNRFWSKTIDRTRDIVGMNSVGVNLEIVLAGPASAKRPDEFTVKVFLQEPLQAGQGKTTNNATAELIVARVPGTDTYRLEVPAWFFLAKMIAEGRREFMTVVRADSKAMPASADKQFLAPLQQGNWAMRGRGVQGLTLTSPSGSETLRQPDARQLILAGGVEILNFTVLPQPGVQMRESKTWCFVRSPADIVFYTGHGQNGNLVTHSDRTGEGHDVWVSPEELLASWSVTDPIFGKNLFDVDVLIINGCSVLNCDKGATTGNRWAQLLTSQKGPLCAILGYRRGAPADSQGGAECAARLAKAIVHKLDANWGGYAREWLEINRQMDKDYSSGTSAYSFAYASAVDNTGYWTLDRNLEITRDPPLVKPKSTPVPGPHFQSAEAHPLDENRRTTHFESLG